MRSLGLEEHRLKSQQEFLEREDLANGKGATELLSGYGSWEQDGAATMTESESSYEAGSSPVFDESFYMGPTQLEAELRATSDAIEEMEGKVAIRLMVAEAVLRGIVRAVEADAAEAVKGSESELQKVKQELQDKDSTVIELISTLKNKEEELVKLVEESRRKERRIVMDMLTDRERILGKIKDNEKYVAQKEKELLKMAEHMVELSLNLAAESKRVNVLEKQIKESKEAESRKGRDLLAVMEKAEQFRAQKESMLEIVRREARLKELRFTESLAHKEEVLIQQLDTIRTLEAAEQQLRAETDVRRQKELQLTESLAEKERVLSQQVEMTKTLETAEQRLREEVNVRSRKELQLSETLAEKEKVLSQHLEMIKALEITEQKLREELDVRSQKDLHLSETLAEKERVLSQQLEAVSTLENSQQQLREELDVRTHEGQQLAERLIEKENVVSQHLQRIKSLETSDQQIRKELEVRTHKELQLTQSLAEKENLVKERVQSIRSLESAEEELKEKLISKSRKVQILTEDLSAKERECREQLETIGSLQLDEEELQKVVENHRQKERFLLGALLEKDELISKQRIIITTLESAEQELKKEAEVQHEKVNDLFKSRKDTSEVLAKLRDTVNFHAETIEEKDKSLRFLQGENEFLNCKIQDSSSVHATLVEKFESYEAEVENQRMQIFKQEAIIRESEIRFEEFSLTEKRLQDEVASLNVKVLEYKDAAQLAQEALQEQSWKHEIETALIITTLEGGVMDLEREINLLGEESPRKHEETVTFRSQILQRRSLEISNLRASKLDLEAKLLDAEAGLEVLEETAKKQKEDLERKDALLENADHRIVQLGQKLDRKESLSHDVQKEVEELKVREQNLKKQREVLESKVQQVGQCLDSACRREQELRAKESHLQTLVEQLEEKIWRLEFEIMFISSYVDNSSQNVLNLVAEVNKRSVGSAKTITVLQLELEAAAVELSKSKEEADWLRSEYVACMEDIDTRLSKSAKDRAEARAGLQVETSNSGRLRDYICELQSQVDGLKKEVEVKLSRKEEETTQLAFRLEESKWQSEVESFIIMGLAEGSIRKLMESLAHAREEIRIKSEGIHFLHGEVEEMSQKFRASSSENSELKAALAGKTQELCTFKTNFVLQNAMQRDSLLQAQTQAKEALKKIEELKRLKLTLLERIQEEKQRWVQLEEALAEQKWKYQFEMDIVGTVMSEAKAASAARNVEIANEEALSPHDLKTADSSKNVLSGTDLTVRFAEGNAGRAKMELKASRTPLSKLDILVRENDELRREKEQLLTQKTDEIYKLKREFYKELEKVKTVKKKDHEFEGLQKESPKSRGTSKPRQQAVSGPVVEQDDDYAKVEKFVTDHVRKVSEMRAVWDAEKSTLQRSIAQREEEIKELVTKLSSEGQTQLKDYSEKLEKVVAEHEKKISDVRALWDTEKATLLESLSQKEDDHERKLYEMNAVWDAEKSTLLESLSQREDEIKGLLTRLSSQSQVQSNDDSAKLEKVVADHEIEVSKMRAQWDGEKSAVKQQIRVLVTELTQAHEKEKECLTMQASLEEKLAGVEKEQSRLKTLHGEDVENLAAAHRNELDTKNRQLLEALEDVRAKSKRVSEVNDEVRQMKDEVSVLRSEISSVRKQMEIEIAGQVQSLIASFHLLETAVTQRTKQYNLRLQRAHSLQNHLVRQCRLFVSSEGDHMQNRENLLKAEAEVDLLGDEVDALLDVLEKVYTVLSHYHPVIQHYPGLADLAKVVRNEVLQRLRDSNDVSL